MRFTLLPLFCAVLLGETALPQAAEDLATAGADNSWVEQVTSGLRSLEYQIATLGDGLDESPSYTASNPAQGLWVSFSGAGLQVRPRPDSANPFRWALAVAGFGRANSLSPVGPARIQVNGNRIEYHRKQFTEWYQNDSRGLEQGFTLHTRPAGTKGLLVLDLAVNTDLKPRSDGAGIDYQTEDGALALRYDHLLVVDAAGRELDASLLAGEDGIRIQVDDQDARYPISIDPLMGGPAWTAENDIASSGFGWSVATAGDVNGDGYSDVIVGAPFAGIAGKVSLYLGGQYGLSTSPALVIGGTGAAFSAFGATVATAGDVNGDGLSDVIVGQPYWSNGQTSEGRALVYLGQATSQGLVTPAAWIVESNQAGATFGNSVSCAGDVNGDGFSDVIVGAPYFDDGQIDEGVAFVYHGSAGGLSATPASTIPGNQADGRFGSSVSTAGDVNGDGFSDVIIGAPYFDYPNPDEGLAVVLHGSASGLLSNSSWLAAGELSGSHLGATVGTAGDVNGDGYSDVVVGAPNYFGSTPNEGRALVYHGGAGGLAFNPAWFVNGDLNGSQFGGSVSTAGDVNGDGYADIIVGAANLTNGHSEEGGARAYFGSASGLPALPSWSAESDQGDAHFGTSVAIAGDVNGDGFSDVIIGAPDFDNGQLNEGRAFVYHGGPATLRPIADSAFESDNGGAKLGFSVTTAGDVNGDGYSDVIVGAPYFDMGAGPAGRVFLHLGGPTGLNSSPSWVYAVSLAGTDLGISVASAGDVNGDGYSDVIVGASGESDGTISPGRARLILGGPSGLSNSTAWAVYGDQDACNFGYSVASAGDVNLDGFVDVIVGAPNYDHGQANEGRAYVYLGSGSGLAPTPAWTAEGDQVDAGFGWSVASAGDNRERGYTSVIVGEPYYDGNYTDEGRALIYWGSASGLSADAQWFAHGSQDFAYLGWSVSSGDVNGDGASDPIVGAPLYSNGQTYEGAAFIYTNFSAIPSMSLEGNQASAQFGTSVSTAGDVNGDGQADVIVGGHTYDGTYVDGGRASLYLSGYSPAAWTVLGDQASAQLGRCVSTAGDVNGDGYADVVVGIPNFDNGQIDEGRVQVYYGNEGSSKSWMPRQRRPGGGLFLPKDGMSPGDSFELSLLARTPFGRGKVRLEWDVTRRLNPYQRDTGTTALADTGVNGTSLSKTVTGLLFGPHAWRARLLYDTAATPFQPASRWISRPWNSEQEADVFINPGPSQIGLDDAGPVHFNFEIGSAGTIFGVPRALSNVGGLPLTWTATEVPDQPWLSLSPSARSGQRSSDPATVVNFYFDTIGLGVGIYTTMVHFQNSFNAADFIDVPVQFIVSHRLFVPGDTLTGQMAGVQDQTKGSFLALAGTKLKLKFGSVTQKMKLGIDAELNGTHYLSQVTIKPGKKAKKVLKVGLTGMYTITFQSQLGSGPFSVQTRAKFPLSGRPSRRNLKQPAGGPDPQVQVLALPGATLSALFKPKNGFTGPMTLTFQDPGATVIDLSGFLQSTANGGLTFSNFPLPLVGTYVITVGGFAAPTEKVKAILTPTQPPPGSSTIVLP